MPNQPSLSDEIKALRDAFKPAFNDQRAVWEREGPAALAAFEETGAKLKSIGGNCPVQGYGKVDGMCFYFRARHGAWSFGVGRTPDDAIDGSTFHHEQDYGSWPDAGWMPQHEAIGFIIEAIALFRVHQASDPNWAL